MKWQELRQWHSSKSALIWITLSLVKGHKCANRLPIRQTERRIDFQIIDIHAVYFL